MTSLLTGVQHKTGHLTPFWNMTEIENLPFSKQPIKDYEIDTWRSWGYTHDTFSGDMYSNPNPVPKFTEQLGWQLGLRNCGFNFYRMKTLDIMPEHVDHFETYMRVFPSVRLEHIRRVILFLEDWKPGHYFEYNKRGFVNWRAGDFVMWKPDMPHAASNIGTEYRYTLQITGVTHDG